MSRRMRNPGAGAHAGARGRWVERASRSPNTSRHVDQLTVLPAHVAEELRLLFEQLRRVEKLLKDAGAINPQSRLPLGGEVVPLHAEVRWIERFKLLALLDVIEKAEAASLGERSKAFLDGLRALAAQYPHVRLSAKQAAWLDSLAQDAEAVEAVTEEDGA
jgi:hypothetical protein